MNRLVLAGLLILLPILAFSQSPDSLRVFPYAEDVAHCDSCRVVCESRGHVQGPGYVDNLMVSALPVVEDTDSTTVLFYPGASKLEWPCLRCGWQQVQEFTDLRVFTWGRRDTICEPLRVDR